jgi:hypothetical protein
MEEDASPAPPVTTSDELYVYDEVAHKLLVAQKPWTRNAHYFKR